jgi:WD40 repeat protein
MAFAPDGKTLASGSGDKTIKLWDIASGKNTATLKAGDGADKKIRSVAFRPDGKTLASASLDGSIQLWDVVSGKNTTTLSAYSEFPCVAFSPDGKILASGVRLWDMPADKQSDR